jgi:hypothetical protein
MDPYPTTLKKIEKFDLDPEVVLEYEEGMDKGIRMTRNKWTIIAAIIWIEKGEYEEDPWIGISGQLWEKMELLLPISQRSAIRNAVEEVYKNTLIYDESDYGYRKKQRGRANGIWFQDLRMLIRYKEKISEQDTLSEFE